MCQFPWARHFQHVWQERAGDPALPDWLRVACLAYGSHRANGHATLGQGHVALVLARVDVDTGVIAPLSRQNVHRAIRASVANGWLSQGSTSRCLIVPAHAVSGGLGSPTDACPQHSPRVRQRGARPPLKIVSDL